MFVSFDTLRDHTAEMADGEARVRITLEQERGVASLGAPNAAECFSPQS